MTLETLIPLKARTGIAALAFATVMALPAAADQFVFSTGNPDGLMATATRPSSPGKFEIETGDDFGLTSQTLIAGVWAWKYHRRCSPEQGKRNGDQRAGAMRQQSRAGQGRSSPYGRERE